MRTIKCSGAGKAAIVDNKDFPFENVYSWCAIRKGNTFVAVRGVNLGDGRTTSVLMHREIWKRSGRPMPKHIRHKNGCGLDNRLENLEAATLNRTGKRGITHKKGKWHASIKIDLGEFSDEFAASWTKAEHLRRFYGTLNPLTDRRVLMQSVDVNRRARIAPGERRFKLV